MSEIIQMKSPSYWIGSLYRVINTGLSINWVGPLETIFETYSMERPSGVEVCCALETIIQAKQVALSFKSTLSYPATKEAEAELESILSARDAGRVDLASSLPPNDLLRIGAFLGNRGMVERSISAGADIDGEGFGKMTALHWAVVRDNVDIARFLVDRGSQYRKTNECSRDIFDLATGNKASKTLDLARELGFRETGVAFSAKLKRWKFPSSSIGS